MRRLEIKLYETVPGPDGKDHVLNSVHTCAMSDLSAGRYATSTNYGRYFLELIRELDRSLDSAILQYKEYNKLP